MERKGRMKEEWKDVNLVGGEVKEGKRKERTGRDVESKGREIWCREGKDKERKIRKKDGKGREVK